MARFYPTNRYIGVNAHLNSYLQQPNGTFASFHDKFLNVIQEVLDENLPANYRAINEKGLQINFVTDDTIKRSSRRPDIAIVQKNPSKVPQDPRGNSPLATIPFLEVEELLTEEDVLMRVGIYEVSAENLGGKLVTTIEILSPANKPKGSNYLLYIEKRNQQLQAQINLVEIDILHESSPIISRLPSYPNRDANAFPYNILVNKPQAKFEEGEFDWYGITVAEALPTIAIPLAMTESVLLDLQANYNEAYRRVKYYQDQADYDTLPVNFEAYTPEDQQRIINMLNAIRQEA